MFCVKQKCKTFFKLYANFLIVVLLLIMTIISLIMAFNGAIAWFSNNKQTPASGMQASIKEIDAVAEYFAYVYP